MTTAAEIKERLNVWVANVEDEELAEALSPMRSSKISSSAPPACAASSGPAPTA